jgi:N-acetylglucosaminyl-diphospho-decaprenol L-rhamnosyltransferase
VVADTGSRDASRQREHRRARGARELPRETGYGAANNAGVAAVRAPVCVLLNPDCALLDDGLARLAPREGELLAPRLRGLDGAVERSAHPRPGTARALLPALLPSALLPVRAEPHRATAPRRVGWAIGACLVARTSTLRALGPFDPAPHLFYEDLDLCLRAGAVVLRPDVEVVHAGGTATRRHFGGEPHDVQARRRREVVAARLGPRALALDDAAQALTFATRAAGRGLLRRDPSRPLQQLHALRRARTVSP